MPQMRGYLLGRLFALLAQQEALERPADQLYSQAAAAPPQVIPKALAIMIETGREDILFPLLKQLPLDAFDGPLNRREQGAFAMGYVHERIGYIIPTLEEDGDEEGHELTERYEFRVDPQLKEWIKTNGGGTFIRTVLRADRTKAAPGLTHIQPPEGGEAQQASPTDIY